MAARVECRPRRRARLHEPSRDTRLRAPKGLGHRLRRGLVLARGNAGQDPTKHPDVVRPRRLQRRIGRQRQHCLLQRVFDRLQAQRNQRLDQRPCHRAVIHGRFDRRGGWCRWLVRTDRVSYASHGWGPLYWSANPGRDQHVSMEAPPEFQLALGQTRLENKSD